MGHQRHFRRIWLSSALPSIATGKPMAGEVGDVPIATRCVAAICARGIKPGDMDASGETRAFPYFDVNTIAERLCLAFCIVVIGR
jgi:hypothetical protein